MHNMKFKLTNVLRWKYPKFINYKLHIYEIRKHNEIINNENIMRNHCAIEAVNLWNLVYKATRMLSLESDKIEIVISWSWLLNGGLKKLDDLWWRKYQEKYSYVE